MADEYEIGLVQYRTQVHLRACRRRAGARLRAARDGRPADRHPSSQHYPLDQRAARRHQGPGPDQRTCRPTRVTPPQWLGPTIAATKNKPVRIVFHNLLPTGVGRRPVPARRQHPDGLGHGPRGRPAGPRQQRHRDGRGAQPLSATTSPKPADCFKDNRARRCTCTAAPRPWISDGTPHQWITPANEDTPWPQGVGVQDVPDMTAGDVRPRTASRPSSTPTSRARGCSSTTTTRGASRRLNVYAGEAAGYLISDDTEKALVTSGTIPGPATRSRSSSRTARSCRRTRSCTTPGTRPATSSATVRTRPGTRPAGAATATSGTTTCTCRRRTPATPSGMSAYGRWMYGPWFWPPAAATVVRADRQPVLRPGLQPQQPGHVDLPDRPVLRAAADPRHAEHLGRHGAVQRHADRQRRGVPQGDARSPRRTASAC